MPGRAGQESDVSGSQTSPAAPIQPGTRLLKKWLEVFTPLLLRTPRAVRQTQRAEKLTAS